MDKELFKFPHSGTLVDVPGDLGGHAFLPAKLPAHWEFPDKLWPLLAKAKEKIGTLNGIGQTLPDSELLLRPLQKREAITSSSLEGTYVTPKQLLLYELDQREPKSGADKVSDWREVFNYSRSLEVGCEMLQELPFCLRIIKRMHKVLLLGLHNQNTNPGELRRWQVQIGSTARFVPPPPEYVVSLMENLEGYINEESKMDPLIKSFLVHYQFESIHPFSDGNGRVGRALLALMIYKSHEHTQPWLYMSAFFDRYKDEYIKNLFRVSTNGDFDTWVEFCLNGVIYQAEDAIIRCKKFIELKEIFHERIEASGSPRTHHIIDMLFVTPFLTVPLIRKRFDIAYQTAKSDLKRLVDARILTTLKEDRPITYYSHQVMRVSFADRIDGDNFVFKLD